MIKCCGRSSCKNVKLKKKPHMKSQNTSTKTTGKIGEMTLAMITVTQKSTQAIVITVEDTSNAKNTMDPTHETTNNEGFQSSELTAPFQSFSASTKSMVNQESTSTSSSQKVFSVSPIRSEPAKNSKKEYITSGNLSSESSSFLSSS